MIIGLIALYIEFSAPGIGAGGLVAGLCARIVFLESFFWWHVGLAGSHFVYGRIDLSRHGDFCDPRFWFCRIVGTGAAVFQRDSGQPGFYLAPSTLSSGINH